MIASIVSGRNIIHPTGYAPIHHVCAKAPVMVISAHFHEKVSPKLADRLLLSNVALSHVANVFLYDGRPILLPSNSFLSCSSLGRLTVVIVFNDINLP